jgi:ubiquinone biosynthesis protein UbiJ
MWFSPTQGDNLNNSAPFATVALAGHQTTGAVYCECDNPNSHLLGLNAQSDDSAHQDENTIQGDLNIELGIALVALALWLKMRA